MIVGILSDTHGRAAMAKKGVKVLIENGAEYLVHCGDVGESDVLDAMAGHPGIFVFGNNDYEREALKNHARAIGLACGDTCGKISFGNKSAVVTHGDDHALIRQLIKDQQIDYLFLGHTHQTLHKHEGSVYVINPGALYRASVKSVALLDTDSDEVQFIPIMG